MISFISFFILSIKFGTTLTDCTDIYGRSITPGIHFIPGPDICQLCVCDNTTPKWCKRVLCSPPQNCKSFVMGSSCCDYSCLDNTIPSGELRDEIDRRFLITIATAFLILTVLLFIIHKLRHRTIHDRIQNRTVTEDRRSIGSIGFITGSIGYLNLSNGHHFDDHPLVHFPVYKPHGSYFPRGEAPPPYEEAVADTALNLPATAQLLTNDRELHQDLNQQRRRSNSAGVANTSSQFRPGVAEHCICEPPQPVQENHANLSTSTNQHRTIPIAVCVTSESANHRTLETVSQSTHRRICAGCPVHNKQGTDPDTHRSRANSTSQTEASTSGARLTCPPQFQFEASHTAIGSSHHRTLPLSASLSSPLPSTSESHDRHSQFTTFSSAVNISSFDADDAIPSTLEQRKAKKSLPSVSVTNETQSCHKSRKHSKKERTASSSTSDTVVAKESKSEQTSTSQLVDDYHAECENCNLNVNAECDGNDDYFSEQETMTLQRKLHENSAVKNSESTMKVSLTLPANSRTRRCTSKNRKCGRWNTKESSVKSKLDYVLSGDEGEACLEEAHSSKKNSNEENI